MTIKRFHIRGTAKRRGGNLPARMRFSARRGTTLVELMIGFLILTIVCLSWFEMMAFQNWTKESARREAVEQLHGMMDAFVDIAQSYTPSESYVISFNEGSAVSFKMADKDYVSPMGLEANQSIGYRLYLKKATEVGWCESKNAWYWLCGELYEQSGKSANFCGEAFCKMKVFIGRK